MSERGIFNGARAPIACFYLANIIITVKAILSSSALVTVEWLDSLLAGLFVLTIGIKLLSQRYRMRDVLLFGSLGSLALYTCVTCKNYYLLYSCLCCFAMQGASLRQTLKYRAWTSLSLIGFHVIYTTALAFTAPESIPTVIRNGVERYDFFLGQPNTFQMYITWTTLEFLFVYFKRIGDVGLCGALAINVIFYLFTNSNTSLQVTIFAVVLMLLYKHGRKISCQIGRFVVRYGYWLIAICLFVLMILYSSGGAANGFVRSIDSFMTGRLAYGAYAYAHFGISYIGRMPILTGIVYWNGQWFDALYFDSSYMALFVRYGIFWLFVIGACLRLTARRTDALSIILLASYVLYGVMESYVLDVSVCFPILMFGASYFGCRSQEETAGNLMASVRGSKI